MNYYAILSAIRSSSDTTIPVTNGPTVLLVVLRLHHNHPAQEKDLIYNWDQL